MTFSQALNILNRANAAEKTRQALNAAIDAELATELDRVADHAFPEVNALVEQAKAVVAGCNFPAAAQDYIDSAR